MMPRDTDPLTDHWIARQLRRAESSDGAVECRNGASVAGRTASPRGPSRCKENRHTGEPGGWRNADCGALTPSRGCNEYRSSQEVAPCPSETEVDNLCLLAVVSAAMKEG
jgi:hypothetical protein